MEIVSELIQECKSLWTLEYEKYAINVLRKWKSGQRKNRKEYHIYENYLIQSFGGLGKKRK